MIFEETAQLRREDGVLIPGITIMPDSDVAVKCNGASVVVLAGEWGLTEDFKARFARPLAELGFFVVATDLVAGATPATAADAQAQGARIVHDRAVGDLEAAILAAKAMIIGKVGVIAFDVAARIAFEAATMLPQIDALVHASGPPPGDRAPLARVRATIQVHQALNGTLITEPIFDDLAKRMKPGRADLLVYDYKCKDNFYARPDGEDEASEARIAWDRTKDFLFQALT